MKFEREEHKYDSGIYVIYNLKNKNVYVGQTKMKFQKRYWHHVWKLNNNQHDNQYLQNAWNKYGADSFAFRPIKYLDSNAPQSLYDELEEQEIAHYKKRGGCYNILNNGTRKNLKCSEETKRLIGEKNRINMLGKKHSEETKRRMSEARKGKYYTRYRKTNSTNDDDVKKIKTMLVAGVKSKDIVNEVGCNYGTINNILSADAWNNIEVDGWEEFQSSRKRNKRATDEEVKLFQKLYYEDGWTIHKIATIHNRSYDLVKRVINLVQDNPVPSLGNEEGQTTIP